MNGKMHDQDLDGRTPLSTKRKPTLAMVVVEAVASMVVVEVTTTNMMVVGGRQERIQWAQGGD